MIKFEKITLLPLKIQNWQEWSLEFWKLTDSVPGGIILKENHFWSLENHKLSKMILWCEFEEITTLVPQVWKFGKNGPRDFKFWKLTFMVLWKFELARKVPCVNFGILAWHPLDFQFSIFTPQSLPIYKLGPCGFVKWINKQTMVWSTS